MKLNHKELIKLGFSEELLENNATKYSLKFDEECGFESYIVLVDMSGNKTGMYKLYLKDNTDGFFLLRVKIETVEQLKWLYLAISGNSLKHE